MRWLKWGAAGLVGLVLVAALAAWLLLDRVNLGPFASRRATAALGRTMSLNDLHVTPGRWLRVTLADAALANAPGGTKPEMARIAHATAEVEAWPLLHGTLVLRHVAVDGLDVLLERIEGHGPNWHLTPKAPQPQPEDKDPARKPDLPFLQDLRVQGQVVLHVSSGGMLPIGLDGLTFTAPALDQPTRLAGTVRYKDVPLQVEGVFGSIAQYRDAATPLPARLNIVSGDTRLQFEGTMTDPINFDGAHGALELDAKTADVLLKVAGAEGGASPAIAIKGQFDHAGPGWQLSRAQGRIGTSTVQDATIHLVEGMRETEDAPLAPPDRLGLAVQFDRLDLDPLLGGQQKSGGSDPALKVDPAPDTLIAAKLAARTLVYDGMTATNVQAEGALTQGEVALKALSLGILGGRIEASGQMVAVSGGARVSATVRVAGLEVQALRGMLDMGQLKLSGRLNGEAVATAQGGTMNQALGTARASLVVTMAGGSVSREIVRLGSTDVRALFGTAQGMVPLSCVLGVVDVRGGVATVTPLRLRTAEGTIAAHGTVDLLRHQMNLVIESESATTGLLALDIPVHVSGTFADPSIAPAQLSAAGRRQAGAGDETGRLVPALQGAARNSPCRAQ